MTTAIHWKLRLTISALPGAVIFTGRLPALVNFYFYFVSADAFAVSYASA